MFGLRLDSSSEDDSDSGSGSNSPSEIADCLRPPKSAVKPDFSSVGVPSVLARAREFIPLFRDATLKLYDPEIRLMEKTPDIKIPTGLDGHVDDEDEASSVSSFGVEVDVGLGVFDVNGAIDEESIQRTGVPVLDAPVTGSSVRSDVSPLIQEVDS